MKRLLFTIIMLSVGYSQCDANGDGNLDVLDIVNQANCILTDCWEGEASECDESIEIIKTNMEGGISKKSNVYISFSHPIDINQFNIIEQYDSLYLLLSYSVFLSPTFWYDNNTNTITFINEETTEFSPDGTGVYGFALGEYNTFTITDLKFSNGCTYNRTFNFESLDYHFNIVANPSSDNTIRFTRLLDYSNISIYKNYPDTLVTINHNNIYDDNEWWTSPLENGIYIYDIYEDIYDSFGDFLTTVIYNQGSIIIYNQ